MNYLPGSNQIQQALINLGRFLERKRDLKTTRKVLLLMFGGLLVVSTYLISLPYLQPPFSYQLGEITQEDIKVRHDIRYELPEETQKLKDEAFVKQRVVFDRNYLILENTIEEIQRELQLIFAVSQETRSPEKLRSRFAWLKSSKQLSNSQIRELLKVDSVNSVLDWSALYATLIFESYAIYGGNMVEDLNESIDRSGLSIRTINSNENQPELIWDKKRLLSSSVIFEPYYYSRLTQLADLKMEERIPKGAQDIIKHRLLQHYLEAPYASFNEPMTMVRKNAASESVTPIFATLRKGLILANKGDPIDSTALRQINIVNQYRSQTNFKQLSGVFLLMFVMAVAVAFFILRFSEFKFRDLSSHIIAHSLMLTLFLSSFLLNKMQINDQPGFYLGLFAPVGYFATMSGILFGGRVTLILGMYVMIFLYALSEFQSGTLILSFIGIMGGIYTGIRMKRRTNMLKGAFTLALLNIVLVFAIDLLQNSLNSDTFLRLGLVTVNAYFSIILTSGILPLYENIFNLCTKFRLMELSDVDHPLLRKMAAQAPSTYTHSLMVANLSERAVAAIDGDALLTKVGCLFHDIGKTLNPTFYAENRHLLLENDKFQKMGPLRSARVITKHVTDGIQEGITHRLPQKIIDFIPEHHGTTTIQFFYHQALSEAGESNSNKKVERKMFQYPGPRPRSKETAVVMIADSLEAAARTVDPGKDNFIQLVDQIVENKMKEEQFAESPLTLADLSKVKEVFVEVLLSSYHSRPVYPSMEDTESLESNVNEEVVPPKLVRRGSNGAR